MAGVLGFFAVVMFGIAYYLTTLPLNERTLMGVGLFTTLSVVLAVGAAIGARINDLEKKLTGRR